MTPAEQLRDRVSKLAAEARARGGSITAEDREAFERRIAEARSRAARLEADLAAAAEVIDLDRDALVDAEGELEDLELELDNPDDAAA